MPRAEELAAACNEEAVAPWEMILFKFEPFVLHIRCADIDAGQKLVNIYIYMNVCVYVCVWLVAKQEATRAS
jgi:hypothetical protein